MLRKRCKIKEYIFRRVEFMRDSSDDATVCEERECKFCSPNIDDRCCGKIQIDGHTTLKDLCTWIDEEADYQKDFTTAYIPDQDLYEIGNKIKKTDQDLYEIEYKIKKTCS